MKQIFELLTALARQDNHAQLDAVAVAADILSRAADAYADGDEDTAQRLLTAAQTVLDASGEPVAEWSTDNVLVTLGVTGGVTITDDGGVYVFGSIDAAISYTVDLLDSLSSASPEWWADDYQQVQIYLEGNR
jgi:hypothetical protein